jgi:hypothetical protein
MRPRLAGAVEGIALRPAARTLAAHEGAARSTLDMMQREPQPGAGANQQTLSTGRGLAEAESAPVADEPGYEKARMEVRRAAGTLLESNGTSIADAINRTVEAHNHQ